MDDINTEQNPQAVQNQPSKKPRRAMKLFIAFLLGALTYALISGTYLLATRQPVDTSTYDAQLQTKTPNSTPTKTENTQITADDLSKYTTPVDCTTKEGSTNLKVLYGAAAITTIDLYDGLVTTISGSTQITRWQSLPMIVDYQCKDIKITVLKPEDRVNIYVDKDVVSKDATKSVLMIQKINL